MKQDTYLIAASRPWCNDIAYNLTKRTGHVFKLIQEKDALTEALLAKVQPKKIFFPHWSWIIPEFIWNQYECIVFHMTDLPFGRGGSPLQNLIVQGFEETKISALRCELELDAGAIYMKSPLSLHGSAEEIFIRASFIIQDMICDIIKDNPTPLQQHGEVTVFKRRTPEQSKIQNIHTLQEIYNHIRMLDAEGYPHACLDYDNFHMTFTHAQRKVGRIEAHVTITLKY